MGRPLLVDSNDQHRQKKRRFSSSSNTLDSFPLNMFYIHWLPRTIMTFRESRPILERATTGSEERESRALSSRRKKRVYTARMSRNDWVFSFNDFTFTFTTGANFVRLSAAKRSCPRIAESRDARLTESTLKTHRMSRRSLNKINMAAINV